ncbi:hypothetical protein L1987_48509 [Smallanthus sonchifolius]|uniref:Uncharacterized protein n=1 Tax=Smallanthus sonchifolius TaxID=185202 RepID=A0ACB9FRV2_9ASTR|nr:hypothetical protein L1987_48509 [Smallanthus sonchifolius]
MTTPIPTSGNWRTLYPYARNSRGRTTTQKLGKRLSHYGASASEEVDENLGWLTSHGTDIKTHLDFHTTDMSGQMNEMEQDIMQNHDKTTTATKEARASRIQSWVAIVVALVVSLASLFLQLYR